MIKFSKNESSVNSDLYLSRLRRNGRILIDKEYLKSIYQYECVRRDSLDSYARDVMKHHSGMRYNSLDRHTIYCYLTDCERCPDSYFQNPKTIGYSVDINKVLKPLLRNGYATEFLSLYIEHRSVATKCSKIKTIIDSAQETEFENVAGDRLYQVKYSVNPRINLRFNYSHMDIIGQFSSEYVSAMSAPKGYCLVWADFAQSDLRIAYSLLLRNEKNYQTMLNCKDKYEGIARLVAEANNEEFNLEEFKKKRNLYKVYVLETIYGTRNTIIKDCRKFINSLASYLEKCEKYQEYIKRINKYVDLDIPVVTKSYFGYEQQVPIYNADRTNIRNFALNSPVQTGTSELMILTVNWILDKFYSMGYTEEDISVYMVRHDEPVFLVKESLLRDSWVFKQSSSIQVDDWIPLELEYSCGYHYKQPDSTLMSKMKVAIAEQVDELVFYDPDEFCESKYYYPVDDIVDVYYHQSAVEGVTVVSTLVPKLKAYSLLKVKSVEESVVQNEVLKFMIRLMVAMHNDGARAMIVHNNFIEGQHFENDCLISFKKERNASLYDAQLFAESGANYYADASNLELPYRDRRSELSKYDYSNLSKLM